MAWYMKDGIIYGVKTKQAIFAAAAIVAVVAIGIAVLVLRTRNTAAVPADETVVEKKVVKKRPVKKKSVKTTSVPASARSAGVSAAKAEKPKSVRAEGTGTVKVENAVEPPKADGADAEKKAKDDNPFPRYLDMFRNDPAALAAEFEKEAGKERVSLAKVRTIAF